MLRRIQQPKRQSSVDCLNQRVIALLDKLQIGQVNIINLQEKINKALENHDDYIDFLATADIPENKSVVYELQKTLQALDSEWGILDKNSLWHWNTIAEFENSLVQNTVMLKVMGLLTVFHLPASQYKGGLRIDLRNYALANEPEDGFTPRSSQYKAQHKVCQENYNQMAFWILQKYQAMFKDGWLMWNKINLNAISENRKIYQENRKKELLKW
ncbi:MULTISPECIES: hypothetical protein [Limosilactobacillus]|uniref:Uncharacterized protein n=1 Tax=Limosilactobacillus mucosae TaxID=97478 RepID=A0AAJ1MAW1_LIMMU|nr:hypothetical protein [Limosilactobacillus mucosae]MDC2829093.1 hypothetical protein [Limosilactobacillus mucosae]